MVYELYVDRIFLINFVFNLYLLMLVNVKLMRTATRMRILAGAGIGAGIEILAFILSGPLWLRFGGVLLTGSGAMVCMTFRPRTLRAFGKGMRLLFGYSFLIGGLLLFLENTFPEIRTLFVSMSGVLGVSAIGFMGISYWEKREHIRKVLGQNTCLVTLITEKGRVQLPAFVDSGNSLSEPISGKPVSIINQETYEKLWGEGQQPYRVIPYHCIGKENGILMGYLLPRLEMDEGGIYKVFTDVFVAVSEETIQGMILNPKLFTEK